MSAKLQRAGEPTSLRKHVNTLLYRLYSLPDRTLHRPGLLVILSHMRSGSTLLTHLLTNHPDICGYGETHLSYFSPSDLDALAGKLLLMLRRPCGSLRARFVLDKILHDWYLTLDRLPLLEQRRAHVVFLIREPRGALTSLMNAPGFRHTQEQAAEHYQTRLSYLTEAARRYKAPRPIAVTYAQIVDESAQTLCMLERGLGLSAPLAEQYQLQRTTGHIKVGDTSPNIQAGMILRGGQKAALPAPCFDPDTLRHAQDAYDACWAALREHCTTLD